MIWLDAKDAFEVANRIEGLVTISPLYPIQPLASPSLARVSFFHTSAHLPDTLGIGAGASFGAMRSAKKTVEFVETPTGLGGSGHSLATKASPTSISSNSAGRPQ